MPTRTWSQSIAAGAGFNPFDGWQLQFLPYPALVEVIHRATAVGLTATFTSGTDTLLQEGSPVPSGGTAGQTPSRLNIEPIIDRGAPGDQLILQYRNPTGGAITVDGIVNITPLKR